MTDVTATLWFLGLAAAARADVFYFNEELDGFFSQFRDDILEANNSQFPLPNVHVVYTKDVFLLGFHGEMNGTGGSVTDLSTIRRTDNVTIVTAKEYFVLRAQFGFEELQVKYDYKARFAGVPLSGDFVVTVGNNSIYVELLMNLTDNRCSGDVLTIRSLRFTALDDLALRVTGFGPLNPLAAWWLGRSLRRVSPSVTQPIEEALWIFFKENIRQFDFCKFGAVPENLPFDDLDSSADVSFSQLDRLNITNNDINAVLN